MGWYVDKGLDVLDHQIKDKFSGITIYNIGDDKHQQGKSDHNPEEDGSVDASDFMIGKHFTKANAEWLFQTLLKYRDKRIAYVIYNRRIYSSTVGAWRVRTYEEDNPHTDHVHVSVNDKHENDRSIWVMAEKRYAKFEELDGLVLPVLKYGDSDSEYTGWDVIKKMQGILGVERDGEYGTKTAAALKDMLGGDGKKVGLAEWQRIYGLTVQIRSDV